MVLWLGKTWNPQFWCIGGTQKSDDQINRNSWNENKTELSEISKNKTNSWDLRKSNCNPWNEETYLGFCKQKKSSAHWWHKQRSDSGKFTSLQQLLTLSQQKMQSCLVISFANGLWFHPSTVEYECQMSVRSQGWKSQLGENHRPNNIRWFGKRPAAPKKVMIFRMLRMVKNYTIYRLWHEPWLLPIVTASCHWPWLDYWLVGLLAPHFRLIHSSVLMSLPWKSWLLSIRLTNRYFYFLKMTSKYY